MILIAAKNMLKLLQNYDLQLSLDAVHVATWSRWPLHACGIADENHNFHPVAHVFASSKTTVSC